LELGHKSFIVHSQLNNERPHKIFSSIWTLNHSR